VCYKLHYACAVAVISAVKKDTASAIVQLEKAGFSESGISESWLFRKAAF
jgi:hypothetical protein